MDPDRERASQTESAVMWDLAVGTLRSWYAEAAFDRRNMGYVLLSGDKGRHIRIHALNV